MWWRPKKRVRFHLADPHPGVALPSVEGLLLRKAWREYVVGVPALLFDAGAAPSEVASPKVVIPRERVIFYEEL